MEKNLLRSLSPVKKDESNETTDFLNSFLSTSEENSMISPSKTISESRTDEDYRPSDELLNAFANLPDAIRYEEQSIKQEPEGNNDTFLSQISIIFMIFMIGSVTARLELRVKEEPCEIQMPERGFSSLSDRKQLPTRPSTSRTTMSKTISESRTAKDYRPSDELLNAFANLPDTIRYDEQSIKQEPEGNYDTFLSQIIHNFYDFHDRLGHRTIRARGKGRTLQNSNARKKIFLSFRSQPATTGNKTKHIKDDHGNTRASTTGA